MINPLMLIGLIPKIPKKWLIPILIGVLVIVGGYFVRDYIQTKAALSVAQVELKEIKKINEVISQKKEEQEERVEVHRVELAKIKGGIYEIKKDIPEAYIFLDTTADDITHEWLRKRKPIN